MNPSVSLQCERAMAALLAANPFGAAVYRSSTQEFSPEVMPAYNLARMESDNTGADADRDSIAVKESWMLYCFAAGTSSVPATEAVDPLQVYAHQQLMDATLGGICRAILVSGSKCSYDTRSGLDTIEVAMQIDLMFDVARLDPSQNYNSGE